MGSIRRRRVRAVVTSTCALSTLLLAAQSRALPSFPGAEGFGAIATGGRGGQVIKVTTLASSGPGSLQAALDTPGPRIIVFEVSGVIQGDHVVNEGDVTIAGQTAPGAGITIAGRFWGAYDASVQNIIVRHLRVRPHYSGGNGAQFDAIQFSLNERLMFDHVSVSWGIDETVDLYEAKDVTFQWGTVVESGTSGHPEGMHNYALINGPDGHRISVHHNLFAHHQNRCPAVANGPADVRNNLAYNVRHGFVHHNPATGAFNITGNVYVQGPNDSLIPFWFDDENDGNGSPLLSYYLSDNYVDDPGDYVGVVNDPWQSPPLHPSFGDMYLPSGFQTSTEHDYQSYAGYVPVSAQASSQTEALVLAQAGAFPRDTVTTRVIGEVQSKTGSWGAHEPSDLMTGLTPTAPPPDGDGDGMADSWELGHGLDPSDGGDHNVVMPSGYTAIEEYVNGLADALVNGAPNPGGGGGGAGGAGSAASGSGSGGGSTTSGAGGTGSGGGGTMRGEDPPQGGASCSMPSGPSSCRWLWAALALPLVLRRRR